MGKAKVSIQPWLPGSLETEYRAQYPRKQVLRAKAGNPASIQAHSVPFTATSTSRADFKASPHVRCSASKDPEKPWPERKFDAQSTYGTYHGEKPAPKNRRKGYCEQRAHHLDTNDYGIHGKPHYKDDFCAWPAAKPAEPAHPPTRLIPSLPLASATDYSANFTGKHAPCATSQKPHPTTTDPNLRFSGCTTYGKEFIEKPIPPRTNACMDRPWMRCDSCPPTEIPTPPGGIDGGGGLVERTWTKPPYAIARAVLDDRTEHKTKFRRW